MTPLVVLVGTVAGVLVGWFLAMRHSRSAEGRLEDQLRQQILEKDAEVRQAREREATLIASESAATTARQSVEKQFAESCLKLADYESQMTELQGRLRIEASALAKSNADLEAARNLLAAKDALYAKELADSKDAHDKAIDNLREAFKALSADTLRQNAPEFLRLANEWFAKSQEAAKGDLSQRQEAIAGLLKPLEEQLRTYQQRLQQTESSQATTLGEVKKQLETLTKRSESLANETERFRMVLKSSQARGRWGEETLRRVVEAAGMSAHCDFVEQTKDEDKQPDMIVRLPGDRIIILDAKVPDLDFVAALETADLEKRSKLLEAHADKLKVTIRDLARRDYPSQFPNSLDYVVLFLPAESLFSAALEGDRDLIIWAANNRIMIATPASLIALLRSVSVSWLQFAQTENTRAIAEAAQELFGRIAKFIEHFDRIRAGLVKANEAFNDAVGSYERMVRPSGERLLKLGLATGGKELPDVQPTEASLRLSPQIVE